MHGTNSNRKRFLGAYYGLFRLRIDLFAILFQETGLHQEIQHVANLLGGHMFLARIGQIAGRSPRHHRGEFTKHWVLPGFIILERIAIDHTHLVFQRNPLHFKESGFLDIVFFSITKDDHLTEIIFLKTGKAHRLSHVAHLDLAELTLAHANQFQEIRRSKPGTLAELAPRERTKTLAFVVVVLHKAVIIFIFKYRFHTNEYI